VAGIHPKNYRVCGRLQSVLSRAPICKTLPIPQDDPAQAEREWGERIGLDQQRLSEINLDN
jgi:hypothetical protein